MNSTESFAIIINLRCVTTKFTKELLHSVLKPFKGKWPQKFLLSHFERDSKGKYEKSISELDILSLPSWIFVDMHDTSQVGPCILP